MHGPTSLFLFVILAIFLIVCWLCGLLLKVLVFPANRPGFAKIYWGLSLLALVLIFGGRMVEPAPAYTSFWFYGIVSGGYAWFFAQLFSLLIMLPVWVLARGRRWLAARQSQQTDHSRRKFLRQAAVCLPVLPLGASVVGVFQGSSEIVISRYRLPLPAMPDNLAGFRILQLSDLHIGPFFGLDRLDEAISIVKKEQPDLVVITGDLIDDLNLLDAAAERLTQLSSFIPQGIHFCWGNHEYFRNFDLIKKRLAATPLTVLRNTGITVLSGQRTVYLAGVDYPWAGNAPEQQAVRRRYMDEALKNMPSGAYPLLIAHHPDFIIDAFERKLPLTLTGHTHGGQIGFLGQPVLPLSYRYMRGIYRAGGCFGYVHTGTGQWLPFRLGCPAEIAIFELTQTLNDEKA